MHSVFAGRLTLQACGLSGRQVVCNLVRQLSAATPTRCCSRHWAAGNTCQLLRRLLCDRRVMDSTANVSQCVGQSSQSQQLEFLAGGAVSSPLFANR
jgi:hypothetical protein